jgi:hypothetical protein
MTLKSFIAIPLALAALAAGGSALAADSAAPTLTIGPSVVKAKGGRMVLDATCVGEARCQAVLTARIDVRNGGLGGQIFKVEPGTTKRLVFTFRPEVRTWLKTHPRTTLVVDARTSNDEYEVVWRGTFRLRLVA